MSGSQKKETDPNGTGSPSSLTDLQYPAQAGATGNETKVLRGMDFFAGHSDATTGTEGAHPGVYEFDWPPLLSLEPMGYL